MAVNTMSTLCRLTVISSKVRADLAVPVDVSVAELMTTLVGQLGREVADEGAAGGGFILQRAGEPPLDPSLTLAAGKVRDGDVLYLRVRSAQLPEVAYDDVLDAVATGISTRTVRWQPKYSTRACTLFASAALALVLLVCLGSGPTWGAPAGVAGGMAALLLGTAIALGRAFRLRGPALTAAGFAVAFAAACGATAVGSDHSLLGFGAVQLIPGAGAAVLASVIAIVALGWGIPGFVAVVVAGILAVIGAAAADLGDFTAAGTASVTAGVALILSPFLPGFAFKLSRLPMPLLPTSAAELRADNSTVDGPEVLSLAARADQVLAGLVGGFAATLAGASVILVGHGASERVLAAVFAVICLLRARLFTGRGQRIPLLIGGGVSGVALLVERAVAAHDDATRILALALPTAVLALVLLALTTVVPGRRWSPPMGRSADVLESMLVLSVLPLILGVAGIYGRVRGWTS